ncbi:Hypothetical protein R9X50_00080700 [Acrodontium crateriforme]|uniref:Rab proteins geranylgeranyltransferase n=1 Tax=Acrodontium crateriforme TaxID=150365 RepID=A0AAQ3LXZ8_9PEZI|nr:Hypothetical protein R9X50_00080700 [Acrodontium crateriforme]
MESLHGSDWDLVIAGTGLAPSLFALAVSRSGLRILHVDHHEYYGGDEAALSLSEAEAWAAAHSGDSKEDTSTSTAFAPRCFSHATVTRIDDGGEGANLPRRLGPQRAYSLALAPQIIYSRSNLVSALVSSHTHSQLEFQAVGSWFLASGSSSSPNLSRVPGGREDVFQDATLDLHAKRSLMKFLRFVGNYEEKENEWREWKDLPLPTALEQKFGLPPAFHGPLIALTLSASLPNDITAAEALPRVARHLRSIGIFGAGFAAVFPKFGGLAEVAQIACRACAVGGGVYVLGKGVSSVDETPGDDLTLQLSGGETVTTKRLVGSLGDLPLAVTNNTAWRTLVRGIYIVSGPLSPLFPSTSEGGVTPAGAVVVVPSTSEPAGPPIHILAHSSESGDCPSAQCVLYASTILSETTGSEDVDVDAMHRLDDAVALVLRSTLTTPTDGGESNAECSQLQVLWKLHYRHAVPQRQSSERHEGDGRILTLPHVSLDLALEDSVLGNVESVWAKAIEGEEQGRFLRFESRGGMGDDE